jgi:hypothetical protein
MAAILTTISQGEKMKKMLAITAFAVAISLPATFGSGRFEIRTRPVYDQQRYDQQRDQQWRQAQENQRLQQQRDRQQREDWQRAQWQRDRQQRNNRHQRLITYEFWLEGHQRDYDNRRQY